MGHSEYDPVAKQRRPWNAGRKPDGKPTRRADPARPCAKAHFAPLPVQGEEENPPPPVPVVGHPKVQAATIAEPAVLGVPDLDGCELVKLSNSR